MLRGINHQQIFEDEEDNLKFLQILEEYKSICNYKIYAYCLMSNHLHLLIKEEDEEIHQIIKRIAGKYVYWYNTKYDRSGHLFQDRFKSEPVEDDNYFLTVLRYIHQNPLQAGIAKKIDKYPYCSYNEYLNSGTLVDTEFAIEMIKEENYVSFHLEYSKEPCMDITDKTHRLTDEDAKKLIAKLSGCSNVSEFQKLDKKKRDNLLSEFKKSGISIRQLTRLTGISKGIVERT